MKYEVKFDITVPDADDIELSEIEEWIKFELEMQASIKCNEKTLNLEWDDLKPKFLTLRRLR